MMRRRVVFFASESCPHPLRSVAASKRGADCHRVLQGESTWVAAAPPIDETCGRARVCLESRQ